VPLVYNHKSHCQEAIPPKISQSIQPAQQKPSSSHFDSITNDGTGFWKFGGVQGAAAKGVFGCGKGESGMHGRTR
jgi:hypothetical protein